MTRKLANKTVLMIIMLIVVASASIAVSQTESKPDVIIVGTGIAGLSAALEMARGGARVQLIDMWSVFGGHAVMSTGGLAIVGSATQRKQNITDSPELAKKDFRDWGEDPDPHWVDYYAENSNEMIGEWLAALGVTWSGVVQPPGNSVPRFHQTEGRGLGLVGPVYREVLKYPNVTFRWNLKVTELLQEDGSIVGVRGEDMRTGANSIISANHVLLATGGFQSNLEMVFDNWPEHLPKPETMLIGSGLNSVGSGHELARKVGASFHRMDHQWNYATGLPHPGYPGEGRALSTSIADSIWVNSRAERFVNELGGTKVVFPAVVREEPATYWAIFDKDGKHSIFVSGSGWQDFDLVQTEILENRALTTKANSIAELGSKIGLDAATLERTVQRFNNMIDRGVDEDFDRFNQDDEMAPSAAISEAPFYGMQLYPMTRKSMGGIQIDHGGRVVNQTGQPILGLYAAGEATGMAGVNGWASLEGTFLGPSLLTGRVAGRTILTEIAKTRELQSLSPRNLPAETAPSNAASTADIACQHCHQMPALLSNQRKGYAHFERVHRLVQEREHECETCHSGMNPYDPVRHKIDRFAQVDICQNCHLAVEYAE